MNNPLVRSSFRDPSGFVFVKKGQIFRQINNVYKDNYNYLINCGLYKELTDKKLLISHKEVKTVYLRNNGYKIIKPQVVPFISYPYEWSFSQLKDAAILTLYIQKIALKYGMSLKDANSYNIQFLEGRPVLIDTLSFEMYEEGPWVAYKQFCQHFLATLTLMEHKDISLNRLLQIYIDGIPLDLASKLLPVSAKLKPNNFIHIFLHSKSQQKYADDHVSHIKNKSGFNKNSMVGLINNLESAIKGLKWIPTGTEWADYYSVNNNYNEASLGNKAKVVKYFIQKIKPKTVWDIGGNTGYFSRIASDMGINTICFDIDPAAVEVNYLEVKKNKENKILPLFMDFTNPSSGIGWMNNERDSLMDRGPVDLSLALAIIHHLSISNNLPFNKIFEFFAKTSRHLIIEFIPKEDSQVIKLLSNREDIFTDYSQIFFEKIMTGFFEIIEKKKVKGSQRTIYLLKNKAKI